GRVREIGPIETPLEKERRGAGCADLKYDLRAGEDGEALRLIRDRGRGQVETLLRCERRTFEGVINRLHAPVIGPGGKIGDEEAGAVAGVPDFGHAAEAGGNIGKRRENINRAIGTAEADI